MTKLMLLFTFPFFAALLMLAFSKKQGGLRLAALALSAVPLLILIASHGSWIGSRVEYEWLPQLSVQFFLKVDELALIFLYLTAIIIPISIAIAPNNALYFVFVFLLQGLLFGFFLSRDLLLFTFFWEAMLLPMYFIIRLWGGKEKERAAMQFLIYMIAGSTLMILAVISLYFTSQVPTFDLDTLQLALLPSQSIKWPLAIFLLAFAVKTPLFPFHGWLPLAYYEAPSSGSILLAALLSKAGIFGFVRIALDLFPETMKEWSPFLLTLAIIGVLYTALLAWVQKDFKKLIAFSSVSHVNFILAGLFVWQEPAQLGAILQAFNHGITITALFLVAYWLEERLGSTKIGHASGLAKFMPHLCWLTLFFALSNVALPGTNNFIGELLILFGVFKYQVWAAVFLSLSVILSVMYMLRWMQKMYFESPSPYKDTWIDIGAKEMLIALPLIILILWIGLYPETLIKEIRPVINRLESF